LHARRRAVLAAQLLASMLALAALPVYVALHGTPSVLETVVLGWLAVLIVIASCLSTGRYERAHGRYRLLARNMADVITCHGRNGAVLFVSPAAELLFGTKDLYGQGLFNRVHVADRPAYLNGLADAAISGAARSVEFRVRRDAEGMAQDAEFVWIEMRCRALASTRGRGAADREVVAVMRDITRHKTQERALEEARAETERASTAKSRFLATMSHELRTPLNAIIGFSEMLARESAPMIDAKRRHEYAQLINDSGRHLLSVVNGILDMSKIESGNFEITPEAFSLRQVIADCCGLLTLKARDAGIDLVVSLPDDLPDIIADKRSLNQIMLNLISNAIKFSDRGGRVSVRARHEGSVLAVTVEDTGVGIDTDDLPRIGAPFFQARASHDRRHDGTGLGLSIVKGLVALHGGEVAIVSRVGEGTRVTVRLPVDCESARAGAEISPIGRTAARAAPAGAPDNRVKISA
jgi:cell cycle sensor histidine kinase DivJ